MIVKCTKLINPNTGKAEQNSPWRTLGREYTVLEIYMGHDDKILSYRLQSDDNKSPTLSHAELFDVTSDYIPSTWAVSNKVDGWFGLGPKSWQKVGFWVAYFDGEEWARELYQREVDKMIDEEKQQALTA